jgi:hypothetical protein
VKATQCSVEDCGNLGYARGYCLKHYQRWYRHGDVNVVKRRASGRTFCTYPGCHEKNAANGLCIAHYSRCRYLGIERTLDALRFYELGQAAVILERWDEQGGLK